jgi:hypothetical protein
MFITAATEVYTEPAESAKTLFFFKRMICANLFQSKSNKGSGANM